MQQNAIKMMTPIIINIYNQIKMVKTSLYITVLEDVLADFKSRNDTGELPKKFSVDLIMKKVREICIPLKEEKKAAKGTGKMTQYNVFVKDNMDKVKEENPLMKGTEKMTEIGRLWQEYKIANPDYKTDWEKTNGSDSDIKEEEKKETKEKVKKEKKETKKETKKEKAAREAKEKEDDDE